MEGFTVVFHAFGKQSKNVISGFRLGINEIFGLLGCYAEKISSLLQLHRRRQQQHLQPLIYAV